jgi:hypothetical protein
VNRSDLVAIVAVVRAMETLLSGCLGLALSDGEGAGLGGMKCGNDAPGFERAPLARTAP